MGVFDLLLFIVIVQSCFLLLLLFFFIILLFLNTIESFHFLLLLISGFLSLFFCLEHLLLNTSEKNLSLAIPLSLNDIPVYEEFDIPQPKENEVLIKVLASTINPSDKINIRGCYGRTDFPFVAGL